MIFQDYVVLPIATTYIEKTDRKSCKICLEGKVLIICSINKRQNKQPVRNSR